MLHFEGDKDFSRAPRELWDKLSDARFLVQCIPDVESVSQSERDSLLCKLRPGFAFVRGTLELTLQVAEAVAAKSVRLALHTKGIGTTTQVETVLAFSPQDAGTRIHWTADVKELGGLLKAVPQGLIRAAAQKVIADAWKAVAAKLAAP
jgi:carbon monoxide dehydrogenase subunit G